MHTDMLAEVEYVIGSEVIFNESPWQPFDHRVTSFCDLLSRQIMSDSSAKQYPDLISFAYYARKANIERLKKTFDRKSKLGWGLALHIPPANVPMNVAFTFLFGLITGNVNLIRLPSKKFPQLTLFCHHVAEALSSDAYITLRDRLAFVTFAKDSSFLEKTAHLYHLRVIWGGDDTVCHFRTFAWAARSIEISFPNRYSFSLLDSANVLELDPKSLQRLVKNFYNDTFVIDQNACSSPSLVIWEGTQESVDAARHIFWSRFSEYASKMYQLGVVEYIDKEIMLMEYLDKHSDLSIQSQHWSEIVTTLQLDKLYPYQSELPGKLGLFFELDSVSLGDVIHMINPKYQTLTYFGYEPEELLNVVLTAGSTGIDRIVPIGQALDMGVNWDGFNLLHQMTRQIISV